MAHNRHLANVCAMNIQVEDGWNEGLLESLCVKTCPIASKRIQSLQNSFLNKLPSASSLPWCFCTVSFPPLFVLLLLLPWSFIGNLPRKTSRDRLPLCFRAVDGVCSVGCCCAPASGDWGKHRVPRGLEWESNRRWNPPGVKDEDNPWARTPTRQWWRGRDSWAPSSHTSSVLVATTSFLPSFLPFWPLTK